MQASHAIEILLWLLIAASAVAVAASRMKIPYAVALVLAGLAMGLLHRLAVFRALSVGGRLDWLRPDVVLILFLPPLLFEASLNLPLRHLRENLVTILLLASAGVLAATLITGYALHWIFGLPAIVALVFGSIVSATDPISVVAVFKELGVSEHLTVILEGESLLNDGTAVVLFGILLAATASGGTDIGRGVAKFFAVVAGGAFVGTAVGFVISKVAQRIDEPMVEITLTAIAAYSSYMAALALHLSGVIAAVAAGLVIGNYGAEVGMSERTRAAVWSFWEYAAFVINSLLFLLIGLEVRIGDLLRAWPATLIAIGTVLAARALSVYVLTPISNLIAPKVPSRWQHLLVWGGLRGALALALVLSLQHNFPYRAELSVWTFGVVAFSIIVQGLSIKPLISALGLRAKPDSQPS